MLFYFYAIIFFRIGGSMKKQTLLIITIFIILLTFVFSKTYAYYIDSYNNTSSLDIAKWKILVNNQDITSESTNNFSLSDFTYSIDPSSPLTSTNNKFAPGMQATTSIEIDSTNVDVSFSYELEIDTSNINNENISITSVTDSLNILNKSDNIYVATQNVNDAEKKNLITITLTWNYSDDSSKDYEFITSNEDYLILPVTIKFKQKTE